MHEVAGMPDRHRTLGFDHPCQVETFDVLHGKYEIASGAKGRVGRDNIGVLETGDRTHLAEKSVQDPRTLDHVAIDDFQHLVPSHDLVVGKVDDAHATATQLADDPVIGMVHQFCGNRWSRYWFHRNGAVRDPAGAVRTDPADRRDPGAKTVSTTA